MTESAPCNAPEASHVAALAELAVFEPERFSQRR
jgi:hypothetical protein